MNDPTPDRPTLGDPQFGKERGRQRNGTIIRLRHTNQRTDTDSGLSAIVTRFLRPVAVSHIVSTLLYGRRNVYA